MHQFFCHSSSFSANKIIIIDDAQIHHIRDVLRLKPRDKVVIFDERGIRYACVIEKIKEAITLSIQDKHLSSHKNKGMRITVACAIPKKSKMDDIIDKLTQLGVDRIIPLATERVIVKLDRQKGILRKRRWEKIALNASQQSQRSTLPVIEEIKNIEEVLSGASDYDLKLILTLTGKRKTLKDIFKQSKSKPKNILVFIGPEGDFTQREVDSAIKAGFIPVSLGGLVLRVDTAAIAVTSFIRLYEKS